MPFGSIVPVATFVHTPIEFGRLQDLHAALHVVEQHTPCAQTFDAHSVPAEHGAPGGFGPHEFAVQTLGAWQLVEAVQASKHFWAPLQTYGKQGRVGGATHCPVALHAEGPV